MMLATSALLLTLFAQQDGLDAYKQGRYAEAQTALEKRPNDPEARAFLAMIRAALKDCAPAAEVFAHEPDAKLARLAGLAAANCYIDPSRALELLTQLNARFPADPDVLYATARLHRQAWDRAVEEMFNKTPASYRVNQLSAEVFEIEGKYGEAAAQYRVAIQKAPESLNLHYRLGRCVLLNSPTPEGREEALKEFRAELKLNPSDAVAEYQVAQILLAQGDKTSSVAHYEAAWKLDATFAEAAIAIGKARAASKDYAGAAQFFERAIALQPANEAAHYNLMLVYRALGRTDDAAAQKKELDRLQKPPEGEFTNFLKKLGEKQ